MKEYKLGYIGSKYIVEVIAITNEDKINKFLNQIRLFDFDSFITLSVDEKRNILNTSSDIVKEFERIFGSETIDLTKFRYLIQNQSNLFNLNFVKIIQMFFELFDYKLYFSYENKEFDRISRMIHLVGIVEDKKHYIELGNSLVGNTIVMQFANKQDLVDKIKIESKNKEYKLIDKIEY